LREIYFDPHALEDLKYWVKTDRKIAYKILELIKESARSPYKGRGKPESLKYELSGCWSRRINTEHRLVYEVAEKYIRILSCRYHY